MIRREQLQALELEKYLHDQIPASLALGIGVKNCSSTLVELVAPLSINLNHKNTAFGGSLSVIAILAGWSIVFLRLQGSKNEIVIQESEISYLKAAKGDFSAISTYEETPQWSRFMKSFNRRGKGRVVVASDVYSNDEIVARHTGTYVAFKN